MRTLTVSVTRQSIGILDNERTRALSDVLGSTVKVPSFGPIL